jgi:hypothetical protein
MRKMPPTPMIPSWFYGSDAIMYFISAMIGILLSFYFYKIYSISSEKRHLNLFWGFSMLSFGLLSLSVSNAASYISFWSCRQGCSLGLLGSTFTTESFSYFVYFGLSILAYAMFIYAYTPKKFWPKGLPKMLASLYFVIVIVALPIRSGNIVWYNYSGFFDIVAFLMLGFVTFLNFMNYREKKGKESLIVVVSFALLAGYHFIRLFLSINSSSYVLAHLSMMASFVLLLSVVTKVKGK